MYTYTHIHNCTNQIVCLEMQRKLFSLLTKCMIIAIALCKLTLRVRSHWVIINAITDPIANATSQIPEFYIFWGCCEQYWRKASKKNFAFAFAFVQCKRTLTMTMLFVYKMRWRTLSICLKFYDCLLRIVDGFFKHFLEKKLVLHRSVFVLVLVCHVAKLYPIRNLLISIILAIY